MKKESKLDAILKWIISNLTWEYIKPFLSFLGSLIGTLIKKLDIPMFSNIQVINWAIYFFIIYGVLTFIADLIKMFSKSKNKIDTNNHVGASNMSIAKNGSQSTVIGGNIGGNLTQNFSMPNNGNKDLSNKMTDEEIEIQKGKILIRATPSYNKSVGITLCGSVDFPFHGELWLVAIVELEENIRSAARLLCDQDGNPNIDLPGVPFRTFLLARIEDGKPYYIAENFKKEIHAKRSTIITRVIGKFDKSEEQIKTENFWYLDYNEQNDTLHLIKANIQNE